jgi:hypothetical protein
VSSKRIPEANRKSASFRRVSYISCVGTYSCYELEQIFDILSGHIRWCRPEFKGLIGDAWKCGEGNRQATPKASTSRAGSITIESPQSTNVCRGSRNRELLFNGHGSGIAIGSGYPLRHA